MIVILLSWVEFELVFLEETSHLVEYTVARR